MNNETPRSGPDTPRSPEEIEAIRTTFGDEGQTGTLAPEIDWSRHPLGPAHQWSSVLRSVLRLAMDSPDPAVVFWGEEHLMFLNDAAIPTIRLRKTV